MLRKSLTLLFAGLLLASCNEMNYTSDVRLVFEGQIQNRDGQPLPNVPVEIYAQRNNGDDSYYYGDRISYGYTDAQGQYRLIIPAPENELSTMSVRTNQVSFNAIENPYQERGVYAIMRRDFQDYTYRTSPLVLYRLDEVARLDIQAFGSGDRYLKDVSISGEITGNILLRTLTTPDYAPNDFSFGVARNQIVTLHYTVVNTGVNPFTQTPMTQDIVIDGNPNQTYNLNY